jgi:hypothetical protein
MTVEVGVLSGDDRLSQQRVDVLVGDNHPPLGREFADDLAVVGHDPRDRVRRVVVERRHLRQIAGVGEEDAAQDPQHGDDHEERDQARVLRDPDDDVGHG